MGGPAPGLHARLRPGDVARRTPRTPAAGPTSLVSDVPVRDTADLGVEQPGIYIGEGLSGYVIVDTARAEIDYEGDDGEGTVSADYAGADGIGVG